MASTASDKAIEVGQRIGRAMARDARAEGMPADWTGIDAQDGDIATAAGIEPGTAEWEAMEAAAKREWDDQVGANARIEAQIAEGETEGVVTVRSDEQGRDITYGWRIEG